MIQLFCQVLILALFVFAWTRAVKRDIDGPPAEVKTGYAEVMYSTAAFVITIALLYGAGTFSLIFRV